VGGERAEPIDVRVISATNAAVKRLADPDFFRQDLLYRINTVEIHLPPLRDRREDIALLLEHFIAIYAQKYNFPAKRLAAAALDALMAHDWPGNVRALRHAVERAVILSEGAILERGDFSLSSQSPESRTNGFSESAKLDTIEKEAIARALIDNDRNVSRAARALGLTRASLYRRMEKYGL
jgi:DNA-binding NtrC family response regulator